MNLSYRLWAGASSQNKELQKIFSQQPPSLVQVLSKRSKTTACKRELSLFILFLILFFLKFPPSFLGRFWINIWRKQLSVCRYSSCKVYYRKKTRVVKHTYNIGLKVAWNCCHSMSQTDPYPSDKCHKRSKRKGLVHNSRSTSLPCWSLQSVSEKVISDSQLWRFLKAVSCW